MEGVNTVGGESISYIVELYFTTALEVLGLLTVGISHIVVADS
jgi:hypothetical protein